MFTTRNNPCYVHFEPKTAKNFFWLFAKRKELLKFSKNF